MVKIRLTHYPTSIRIQVLATERSKMGSGGDRTLIPPQKLGFQLSFGITTGIISIVTYNNHQRYDKWTGIISIIQLSLKHIENILKLGIIAGIIILPPPLFRRKISKVPPAGSVQSPAALPNFGTRDIGDSPAASDGGWWWEGGGNVAHLISEISQNSWAAPKKTVQCG